MLEQAPPSVMTVAPAGEFDVARTAELRDGILADYDGEAMVIADMGEVTFMDSTALRALLEVRAVLEERGGVLMLTNLRPIVARLLEVTGLNQLFGLGD
jgi:anti-sigma B factor antagonist